MSNNKLTICDIYHQYHHLMRQQSKPEQEILFKEEENKEPDIEKIRREFSDLKKENEASKRENEASKRENEASKREIEALKKQLSLQSKPETTKGKVCFSCGYILLVLGVIVSTIALGIHFRVQYLYIAGINFSISYFAEIYDKICILKVINPQNPALFKGISAGIGIILSFVFFILAYSAYATEQDQDVFDFLTNSAGCFCGLLSTWIMVPLGEIILKIVMRP